MLQSAPQSMDNEETSGNVPGVCVCVCVCMRACVCDRESPTLTHT